MSVTRRAGSGDCWAVAIEPTEAQDFSVRILETGAVVNVVTEALVSNPESGELNQELLQVINR